MLSFKDGDKNTYFCFVVVKNINNSSGIHMLLLRILSSLRIIFWNFTKTSMFILILMLTLLVLTFLPWFLLRIILCWLNVWMIWKSRMLFLFLMVIVPLVLMVLVVFSFILDGRLLGQMFAKLFNSFLNKIGFFLGWIVIWSPSFLRFKVLIPLKISDTLLWIT